jgi:hypothetical protein
MKSDHSVEEFKNHVEAIHMFTTMGVITNKGLKWHGKNKAYYNMYKRIATESRGLDFELSEAEFMALRLRPCYLCGTEACTLCFNGIDRKDSKLGYTTTNSMPCCPWCNRFKNNFEYVTFIEQCGTICSKPN